MTASQSSAYGLAALCFMNSYRVFIVTEHTPEVDLLHAGE